MRQEMKRPPMSVLDLYRAECDQMHALCDRSQIPREIDGEVLSTAQRVTILAGAYDGLRYRIGMGVIPPHH